MAKVSQKKQPHNSYGCVHLTTSTKPGVGFSQCWARLQSTHQSDCRSEPGSSYHEWPKTSSDHNETRVYGVHPSGPVGEWRYIVQIGVGHQLGQTHTVQELELGVFTKTGVFCRREPGNPQLGLVWVTNYAHQSQGSPQFYVTRVWYSDQDQHML